MLKSIFFKYFIVTIILVCLCFTLLGAVLFVMTANYSIEEQQNQLMHAAQNLSKLTADMEQSPVELYMNANKSEEDERTFAGYLNILSIFSQSGERDIILVNASGDTGIWFTNTGEINMERRLVPIEVINQVKQTGVYKSTGTMGSLFSESRYTVGVPMISEKNTESNKVVSYVSGYLFVCSPAKSLTSMLTVVTQFYCIAVGVVLIISVILVFIGTRTQARPMREIRIALDNFSKGDFSRRVQVRGNDEVAQLCASFNEMADALEQVENSRRSFMANISHDLKTPLTSIVGFIDGILDGTIPQDRSAQYLKKVSTEMKRLSRLVYSILDVTRLEGGQVAISPMALDINEVVRQVMFSFERSIDKKEIHIDMPVDEGLTVRADEDSVYRILTNLIGNAVKFTPIGGWISVTVERYQRQHALIRVRNSGEGIAESELPHLFERFYKSDSSRGLDKEGTGLGLYIAKMLVTLNKGEIWAESTPGLYTEFAFTLECQRDFSVTGRLENMIKKQ